MDRGQILWKLSIRHISRPFFFLLFSNFLIFKILRFFFLFSLTWDPMGAKISKRILKQISPTVPIRFQPNFMTNVIVMGEYRLLRYLAIC